MAFTSDIRAVDNSPGGSEDSAYTGHWVDIDRSAGTDRLADTGHWAGTDHLVDTDRLAGTGHWVDTAYKADSSDSDPSSA